MNSELDSLTTETLIELALAQKHEDDAGQFITVLQLRANREVFESAKKLCKSDRPQTRALGIDIISQLGIPDRAFPEESLELYLKLLELEKDSRVLHHLGVALGYLQDIRGIKPLVKFKNHPDAEVRYGVVMGLLSLENELAIHTLIELSTDVDPEVRTLATCALGSHISTDTEAIRDALFTRFFEEDCHENYEIYGEALVGLAKRKDPRIIPALLDELASDCVNNLAVEAAAAMDDSQLNAALEQLKEWFSQDISETK
jgi:HEAT repeat protein